MNMKKLLLPIIVLSLATAAFAISHLALGQGSIAGGAVFNLALKVPPGAAHPNVFRYMKNGNEVVVRHFARIDFDRHSVHFVGPTEIGENHAMVFVDAFDGGPAHPDGLHIVIRDGHGNVLFEDGGPVVHGDIVVRHAR